MMEYGMEHWSTKEHWVYRHPFLTLLLQIVMIILMFNAAVAFCNWGNRRNERKEQLNKGIVMKELYEKDYIKYETKKSFGKISIVIEIDEKALEEEMKEKHYGYISDASCWISYGLRDYLQDNWPYEFGEEQPELLVLPEPENNE